MTNVLATLPLGDTTSLDARMLGRLARLGQRVRLNGLGHRRLSESDTRSLTTALLRDIDETILPRHVRVTTNAGQRFALDIAGRRLLRLMVSGSGGSVGQPDDPVEAAKLLAAELRRALLRSTELTLQTQRMDSTQDREHVGCSAAALASALGLDLEALEGESVGEKALRTLNRHADAVISVTGQGEITHHSGAADPAGRLEALARTHFRDVAAAMMQVMGRGQRSGCLCLGTDVETGAHLVCAVVGTTRLMALVDVRRIDALLPVLQDIFAK